MVFAAEREELNLLSGYRDVGRKILGIVYIRNFTIFQFPHFEEFS